MMIMMMMMVMQFHFQATFCSQCVFEKGSFTEFINNLTSSYPEGG